MDIRLYNTLGRELQVFEPLQAGTARMYACGPTVYNYAHIGNLRTYVFEDLLRRTFIYFGYAIEHVMNVTDVGHLTDDGDEGEDKMIKSAREQSKSVWDIAEFFAEAFFRDLAKLNVESPEVVCKATDHITDMIDLIRRLEERGYTYLAGGNLYFDVGKFERYGELALLDRAKLQAGARVEVDVNKRNPQDFVLWFTNSKFDQQAMLWDSPWGKGYPGWHIECSAMSMRYLGDQFDIHLGGVDHIPVHHTNEIAQSEAATGKPWVRYWIHGEFLVMTGGKMSKSAGGFITLESLEEMGYHPLDFRYFCLGGHYRTQLQFTEDSLNAARAARRNLLDRVGRLRSEVAARGEASGVSNVNELGDGAQAYMQAFEAAVAEDLNIPKALAELWQGLKDDSVAALDRLEIARRMDRILAIGVTEAAEGVHDAEIPQEDSGEIEGLITERNEARKSKNFARADEIRDYLKGKGVVLEDGPEGTRWKRG
ncbi:MAG: cysteine--tRNA ligase [Spirochaetia bacterium]